MATQSSDVDLVYLDLCDALETLNASRPSPRDVRRALSRYVELSQRLTSVMRRDFKHKKGGKWEATTFTAWTTRTEFLKYLRNQDQHSDQVFITVHDRHYFDVPDDVEIAGISGRQFIVDSVWQMNDQTVDHPPQGLEIRLVEQGLSPTTDSFLTPVRTDSWYELYPRSKEQKQRTERADVGDVHAFAADTFVTLTAYYEHYKRMVDA